MLPYSNYDFKFLILSWIIGGAIVAYYANRRGMNPFFWFSIGGFFGPLLGIIMAYFIYRRKQNRKEPHSSAENHSSSKTPIIEDSSLPLFFDRKQWYFLSPTHEQQGPIPFESLKISWKGGNIIEKTYVWCVGMDNWKKIHELPQLHVSLDQ